jgi:hypothetical protein
MCEHAPRRWAVAPRTRGQTPHRLGNANNAIGLNVSAVNFALQSDFRWLLVLPPLAWAAAFSRCYPAAMPVASSAAYVNVSIAALAVIGSRVGSSS